ncbi:hypothetical protein NDN01_17940 [Sphingomonas sp. QA11]|uniref:hypothetical protein n=1 Tax=Sphingomonas sp. QA11 TaxID=2950605 RepID=UPI00234BFB9F|nr:hypothetical protein [Sphingomonas sp. QA11]WCM25894.1 hypothetical protein NDN01_17940 [Sphingomonas sp. QA11]
MNHIITRLFDDFADAQHAVIELERVGVSHGDISLVSHKSHPKHAGVKVREPHDHTAGEASAIDGGVGAATGGVLGAAGGALAGLGLLAIPGLGPVVAAGWLASAAVGALVGGAVVGAAGGLVGALTHAGVSQEEADVYAEGVRRGGTLVSAKVDDEHVALAEAALDSTPSVDIATRGAAYRQAGWTGFDAEAAPYSDAEISAERTRYVSRV